MSESKPKKCTYPNCDNCGFEDDCHYFGGLPSRSRRKRKSRFDKYKGKIKQMVADGYSNQEIADVTSQLGEVATRRQIEQYILNHGLSAANCGRKRRIAKRKNEQR